MPDLVLHAECRVRACDLTLGFKGRSCSFEHRPFEERSRQAQAAYLKLQANIDANGIQQPLIIYRAIDVREAFYTTFHVLVGMRRLEIWRSLRGEHETTPLRCIEILEDVHDWTTPDIDRLEAFKREIYPDMEAFKG